jgi:hypothetical protein
VRRGLANMKLQAYLTAAAVNLKRLPAAIAVLLILLLIKQSRSCTANLMGGAFATAPVVCLTLAKWETVNPVSSGAIQKHPSGQASMSACDPYA